MVLWRNDKELFAIAKKELFVALVGDILDTMVFPTDAHGIPSKSRQQLNLRRILIKLFLLNSPKLKVHNSRSR